MRRALLSLGFLLAPLAVGAAQQCPLTSGTYGGNTVTMSAYCISPMTYNGVTGNYYGSPGGTCTIDFSAPVATSGVTVEISGHDPGDDIGVATNGNPYTVIAGDVTNTLSAVAGKIGTSTNDALGTFSFTGTAPLSVTKLDLTTTAAAGGSVVRVCFDDAAVTPTGTANVPTMSEWGMIIMSGLLAMFAWVHHRRRKN